MTRPLRDETKQRWATRSGAVRTALFLLCFLFVGCGVTHDAVEHGAPAEPSPVADHGTKRGSEASATPQARINLPGRPVDAASGTGSLWILTRSVHHHPGHLVQVDPRQDRILSTTPVPSPQALAVKWGSVWVVESKRDSVVRIDARTGRRSAVIHLGLPRPVGSGPDRLRFLPFDIAAGAGSIWVSTARGWVARIDPTTDRIREQIPLHVFDVGAAITIGAGAVWLGGGLGGPIRIDPRTGTETSIPIKGPEGSRMIVGSLTVGHGLPVVTGELAMPAKARGHRDYVAGERSYLAFLTPRGRPVCLLRTAEASGITRGSDGSLWLSGWPSRDLFAVALGIGAVQRVLRMATPGHLLAARGHALWVAGPRNVLARYEVAGAMA